MPDAVELAVIVTPPQTVPGVMDECVAAGVKGAIVISAGFKETGPAGEELERQVLERARRGGIRVIGPNCLGVMNPVGGLNATFAAGIARPGSVGLISQSGALLTAVLDWSMREQVGFSSVVSLGSMLDVGWGDVIYYLGDDPNTGSIVIYMETVGDARAFLSAAREVALTKPIIVIKPGRTAQAAKAAASHTGSLTGSDEVLDAAFRRVGVLRVDAIQDLFAIADVLAKQPRPKGRRLTIVTNAGGPGVLATDALIGGGGQLTELTPGGHRGLQRDPARAVEPQQPGRHHRRRAARAVRIGAGDRRPRPGQRRPAGRPHAPGHDRPDADRRAAGALRAHRGQAGAGELDGRRRRRGRHGDPAGGRDPHLPLPGHRGRDVQLHVALQRRAPRAVRDAGHAATTRRARSTGRSRATSSTPRGGSAARCSPSSSRSRCSPRTRFPSRETRIAPSEDEAVAAAEAIGYPVVLKLHSHTITHKTDVGGVQLNLRRRRRGPRGLPRDPGLPWHSGGAPSTSRASPSSP